MSPATLAGPARRRRSRGEACDEPPRLFGDEAVAVAVAAPLGEPVLAAPAPAAPVLGTTLADLVADAWEGLAAGAVTCVACGAPMQPRWSATAVVGGRCDGCGTTVE